MKGRLKSSVTISPKRVSNGESTEVRCGTCGKDLGVIEYREVSKDFKQARHLNGTLLLHAKMDERIVQKRKDRIEKSVRENKMKKRPLTLCLVLPYSCRPDVNGIFRHIAEANSKTEEARHLHALVKRQESEAEQLWPKKPYPCSDTFLEDLPPSVRAGLDFPQARSKEDKERREKSISLHMSADYLRELLGQRQFLKPPLLTAEDFPLAIECSRCKNVNTLSSLR